MLKDSTDWMRIRILRRRLYKAVRNRILGKGDIRFLFAQSPCGSISGLAFKEDGNIVASFKLEFKRSNVSMQGKSWSSTILTMVCGTTGVKVYDIFDEILSKYGERDSRSQTGRRICSRWRMCNSRVKAALREIKETLGK